MIGPFDVIVSSFGKGRDYLIRYVDGNLVYLVDGQGNGLTWDVGIGAAQDRCPTLVLPEKRGQHYVMLRKWEDAVSTERRNLIDALQRRSYDEADKYYAKFCEARKYHQRVEYWSKKISGSKAPTREQIRFAIDILDLQVRVDDIQAELKMQDHQEYAKIRRGRDGKGLVLKSDDGYRTITLEEWLDGIV